MPVWLVYPGATVIAEGHSPNLGITAAARNIAIGTDADYRDVAAYLRGQFAVRPGWVPDGSSSMVGSVEEIGTCVWHDASVRVRVGFQEPSTWSKRHPGQRRWATVYLVSILDDPGGDTDANACHLPRG